MRAKGETLRVVHGLGWYFPDSSGGTEVYVDGLARHLAGFGVHSAIAAPSDDRPSADYAWNGFPVHRYPVPDATREEIAQSLPHGRFDEFSAWLEAQNADVYHQHSWTRGCGLAHLRVARRLGLPTVVTVHVPGVVCLRGTMMLDGRHPCDGHVAVDRCGACWGSSRGIPPPVARLQSRRPELSLGLARVSPSGRLRTALLTPHLVARHRSALVELGRTADRVVAVCRWLHDALALNGLPLEKLAYCPQGTDLPVGQAPRTRRADEPFRIGFLGRWDPDQGHRRSGRRLPPSAGGDTRRARRARVAGRSSLRTGGPRPCRRRAQNPVRRASATRGDRRGGRRLRF